MDPSISPVIVTSRRALDEAIASAVERSLGQHVPPSPRPESRGVGWLSNRGAMDALGVSKATLARWRADGTLPYSKIGSSIFYEVEAVEAVLASRRVRCTA